ncbi:RHS repeat-associated core domain-containing protein [Snodgrassella alvi]
MNFFILTATDSNQPRFRIEASGNQEQHIRYFHTDLNGMPEELTDETGEIVWECSYQLWGKPIQEIAHTEIQQNLRYQGQYLDRETGLHYNTFRYYDPGIGRFTQPDPIGLGGGYNLYQYAPNALIWIDPWGWCKSSKKASKKYVYRELNPSDRIRVDSGLSILPKGEKGTIVDHVKGKDTGYISVSENISGTTQYSSNNGLAKIDVTKATQNGAKYIPHKNVQQIVNTKGSLTDRKNVKSANEGLFQGEIPYEAIEIIK